MDFMLDAGHDLYTSGKGVPSMKEFEFNRAVVLKIQEFLKQYENVNTHLSHDLFDGIDTSLKARTDLANKLKVKAYISIHADAFSNASAKGETVFIYTKAGNSTLALANAINDELKADLSISNRGVKRQDFHVLRETAMDAILIEFGFMTNPEDLALLKSEVYRTKCAEMVVKALAKHYGLKKKVVAQVVAQPTPTSEATVPDKFGMFPNPPIMKMKALVKNDIRKAPSHDAAFVRDTEIGEVVDVYGIEGNWYCLGGTHWVDSAVGTYFERMDNPTPIIRSICTGGYSGTALQEVHTYLMKTGHSFDCKRGVDGSIVFLIGRFDTSQPSFKECKAFIDKWDGHAKLLTDTEAAEWRK